MRSPSKIASILIAFLLVSAAARAQAPADEAALLKLWQAQNPSNHAASVRAFAAFEKQFTNSALDAITRGLVCWHAMQVGDRGDAVTKLFESMISDSKDILPEAASTMARRWLTRLDRERVKDALKYWYARHVSYPNSIDELAKLPPEVQPPLKDRWGRAWRYRLTELKHIRGIAGQKYVLESTNMDRDYELKDALAKTYDVATLLKPQKILSRDPGRESVNFSAGREPVMLTIGTRYRGVTLVYVGQSILILTDDDHWTVMPTP